LGTAILAQGKQGALVPASESHTANFFELVVIQLSYLPNQNYIRTMIVTFAVTNGDFPIELRLSKFSLTP
jgi:hypothetical protein